MTNTEFNPENKYQEAMAAHQSGQSDLAEKLLREIMEYLPNQDGIIGTLGGVLLAAGKFDESIELLKKAIKINPENTEAILNLGIAYQSIGRIDEGFNLIQKVAELEPESSDIQYNLANVLIQTQKFPEAILVLNKVLKLKPDFIQAYNTLAAVYGFTGDTNQAINTFEKALNIVPNDLITLINLGNIYSDTGMLDNAELTYSQAADVHPNHFLPHAVLGKFYLDLEKDNEAEHSLLRAFQLNPNDLNTNILLGNVYREAGKNVEAEKFYRKALKINPDDAGANRNLRRVLSTKIPYWHFEMLADTERNNAYQKAIEKVIDKESIVLDIGTGSGLLSMMAARAGAKQVVACELHSHLAEKAKEIIQLNGYEKTINVFSKKSTALTVGKELPEKADIVISEILDVGVLGEAAMPSIRHALQNLAKPNAILIPAKAKLFGQLIEIPSRSKVTPIRTISDFDLSPFDEFRIPDEYLKINLKAEKHKVLSPVIPIFEVDFYNLPSAFPDDNPRQIPLHFSISENGNLQAIVFWFDLYLDENIMVSSRENGELEHWGQALFCFENPKDVKTGDLIPITMFQSDQNIRFKM